MWKGSFVVIRCNLSKIMGKSRLKIEDIHRGTGLSRTTISKLYHDKMERIDYETLSKLCSFLECQVGDILEYYKKK